MPYYVKEKSKVIVNIKYFFLRAVNVKYISVTHTKTSITKII